MKNLFKVLAVTLACVMAIGMSACETQEGEAKTGIELSTQELTFAAEGGSQKVTVTGEGTITATPSDAWITATVTDNVIMVSVEGTQEARSGSITVSNASDEKVIKVTQTELEIVPVSEIILSDSVLDIVGGETKTLSVTEVLPANASNDAIEWTSDDSSIATVLDGVVTAVAKGTTNINATALDGSGVVATCEVSVHDIYVGGRIAGDHVAGYATIWKNGVAQQLSETDSFIFDIDITENDDVYATGYALGTYAPEPVIWKNGVKEVLSIPAPGFGIASSIQVIGEDIYVVGKEMPSTYTATLWKNGVYEYVGTPAISGRTGSDACAVYVAGNDVYVCGYFDDNYGDADPLNNTRFLVLWKNGVEQRLSDNPNSTPYQMYVSGDDFYIAGVSNDIAGDTGVANRATLWKNGVRQILNSEEQSEARSVYVNGDDVYVVGIVFEAGSSHRKAALWKNGEQQYLSEGLSQAHYVNGMGDDIYVAGFIQDGTPAVTLWKNGMPKTISEQQGDAYFVGFSK